MTKCESRFDTQYKRQDSLPGELKAHKAVQSGTGDMQESAANGVNGVVAQWFNGKGIEAPDDFWLAYLAETLADGDSVDLEQISELLSSCSSELAGEAATVAALSLVEQVRRLSSRVARRVFFDQTRVCLPHAGASISSAGKAAATCTACTGWSFRCRQDGRGPKSSPTTWWAAATTKY
jgi:hypothetical protein